MPTFGRARGSIRSRFIFKSATIAEECFGRCERRFHSETLNRLLILQSCLFGERCTFFVTGIIRSRLCGLSVPVLKGPGRYVMISGKFPPEIPPRNRPPSSAFHRNLKRHSVRHLSDKSLGQPDQVSQRGFTETTSSSAKNGLENNFPCDQASGK